MEKLLNQILEQHEASLAHVKRLYEFYHSEHPLLARTTGEDSISAGYALEIDEFETKIEVLKKRLKNKE